MKATKLREPLQKREAWLVCGLLWLIATAPLIKFGLYGDIWSHDPGRIIIGLGSFVFMMLAARYTAFNADRWDPALESNIN